MMKPSDIRAAIDADLTDVPRDILEFNYHQLAKGAAAWVDMVERQTQSDIRVYRQHLDLGAYTLVVLNELTRSGRKTARIDTVIEQAQTRLAAAKIPWLAPPAPACPCPTCKHHVEQERSNG